MDYEKKDFRKLYEDLVKSDWFKKAYHNKSLGECPFDIPELAESEDERIRKWLIEEIKATHDYDSPTSKKCVDDALAYLERQKEQKPAECMEDSVKFEEGFKTGRELGLRDGQKYVLNNLDSYGLCKPSEWSEEDGDKLEQCIRIVRGWEGDYDIVKSPYSNFLKSLRPQPKQEWSEKGEKILDSLIRLYGGEYSAKAWPWSDGVITYGDVVNFLKSLRPQSHWKPSEEQMTAFKGYIEDFQARAEAAVGGWNNFDVMIRLYEQLKKLK